MFKIVLTTISTTIVIISFIASIFFNSILGWFNLATIPLNLLPEFYQSKQIIQKLNTNNTQLKNNNNKYKQLNKALNASNLVHKDKTNTVQKLNTQLKNNNKNYKQRNKRLNASNLVHKDKINAIKKRHKTKSLDASKKFAQRSGKKITSSAIAAATVGTAGVVLTVAGLEVYDYCEDKQELLNDENILFDAERKFDYETCFNEATKDSEKIIALVKKSSSEAVNNAWDKTKDISKKQWQEMVEESNDIWQKTKVFSKDQWWNIKISTDYILQQINYSAKKYWKILQDNFYNNNYNWNSN